MSTPIGGPQFPHPHGPIHPRRPIGEGEDFKLSDLNSDLINCRDIFIQLSQVHHLSDVVPDKTASDNIDRVLDAIVRVQGRLETSQRPVSEADQKTYDRILKRLKEGKEYIQKAKDNLNGPVKDKSVKYIHDQLLNAINLMTDKGYNTDGTSKGVLADLISLIYEPPG